MLLDVFPELDKTALFLVAIVLCTPMPRGAGTANDP